MGINNTFKRVHKIKVIQKMIHGKVSAEDDMSECYCNTVKLRE